ncbi:hypothetical protein L6R49_23240, partial [Myxococcota bacterium]|nr:hypothetical protein [Myxococcota bacterium]
MEAMLAGLACIAALGALVLPLVSAVAAFNARSRVAALTARVELLELELDQLKDRQRVGAAVASKALAKAPAPAAAPKAAAV